MTGVHFGTLTRH